MLSRSARQVALALAFGLLAAPVAAQPPEEEETTPKKAAKVIPIEDPDTTAPDQPGQPVPDNPAVAVKLDDLARAAASAKNPKLKDLFATFAVAFDRMTESNGKVSRILPVPLLWGRDRFPKEFGVAALDAQNQPEEPRAITVRKVREIVPFERLAVDAVTDLLRPRSANTPASPDDPPPADALAAAERVLTAVLFFHDSARDQNRRRGKSWEEVKVVLYDKLTDVRVARLKQAGADRNWALLRELSGRLVQLYKSNPKVLEQVYVARLAEAEVLVQSGRVTDLERGRELLAEYESRFPHGTSDAAKRVKADLAKRAKEFIAAAGPLVEKDRSQARNLLQQVEAIDPDNPALHLLQQRMREAGYAVLVVGTRRLPERMSPALARFDSEKQAAELMFEGLYEAIPDDRVGVRFRPALASDRAGVGASVRDVPLVGSAEWAGPDRGAFTSADVAGTLRLYREKPNSWAAAPVEWYDAPGFDPADPGRIRIRLKAGHPDPRTLLTLKMLPAQWLLEKTKPIDDLDFARRPFGTGPFKLAPDYRPPGPGEKPRDVHFVANPAYARRPGRVAQPFIKEIAFTDVTGVPDLPNEFRAGRLHILTDVPTADLPKYTANNGLNGRVKVATAAVNRRVWILAVNHRRPALQNPDIRRGIAAAIDREKVLNEVFRAGQDGAHKAMVGPFPPASWVAPAVPGQTLYKPDVAQARLRQYLASPGAAAGLSLTYPADDPQAQQACERVKAMVEAATAMEDRKLTVGLVPLPPREVLRRVEDLHDFDLAYLPLDYPDDWFPLGLGSFLDERAAGPGGRNVLGYLSNGTPRTEEDERLARQLFEVRAHRDPEALRRGGQEIHKLFNDAMPFVPLWQLDRHMVMATAVKVFLDGQTEEGQPRLLDPTTLFSSVGRWRVE